MKTVTRIVCVAAFVIAFTPAPEATAGGHFGLHISNGGFGVTVGIGDWGPYSGAWASPTWSVGFSAALGGYGEWVTVGGLGSVWRPWVAVGWRPYTNGRWVMTTYGWTWVAYEPWGYYPHHYGSWAHCSYGWVWVPGYSYHAANVVWVQSGGYVGWYARPPHGWSHAARGYRHGYRNGYHDGWRDARYATYVDWHHVAHDNVSHHAVGHSAASRGHVQTLSAAPTAREVQRRGGASVPRHTVSTRSVTVDGRQVTLARPDGVARSIERHAATTVSTSLSAPAIERRQPAVRSRTRSQPRAVESRTETESRADGPINSSRLRSPAASGTSLRQSMPGIRQMETGGGQGAVTRGRHSGDSHQPQPEVRRLGPVRDSLGTSMGTTPMVRPSMRSDTRSRTRTERQAAQRPSANSRAARRAPTASSARSAPQQTSTRRHGTSSRAPQAAEAAKPRRDNRTGATSRKEQPRSESDPTPSRRRRR